MKTFLITFGFIFTLIALIWGGPALIKTIEQVSYDPQSVAFACLTFSLFLALGLIPLIIGFYMKNPNEISNEITNKAIYIEALKLLEENKFDESLNLINQINSNYIYYKYTNFVKGIILFFNKDYINSKILFEESISYNNSFKFGGQVFLFLSAILFNENDIIKSRKYLFLAVSINENYLNFNINNAKKFIIYKKFPFEDFLDFILFIEKEKESYFKNKEKKQEEKNYYLIINNTRSGPYSINDIKNLENIKRDTLVWRSGLEKWIELEKLNELKEIFKLIPPSLPKSKYFFNIIQNISKK